jgi:hypothetical protein
VPEFVVAISVTEAEDKFRKSWKRLRYIKNITYAIDIII